MSSRKEEERNEKIIRGLMKLPPNRRCINCNSLGPQYVCTNFWTFVCMTCSGIHREFTHRVKSVSMSKFTSQEVEALQEGGNQRARETFLKDWDPREQKLPDNSNVDKVRDFIKCVYVDKKYFASKASGKPPRDTLNNRNHEDETRRASSYHSYSQSPPYDYQYEERRYGKQAPALTKKPGSDRGMFRFLSTSRLSDHVQDDRFANEVSNARVSDYSVTSGADLFRSDTQSPPTLSDSSGSGKFDGLDLFNPPQSVTSVPSFESGNFNGLDLFNPPQSVTSVPSIESGKSDGLDLFRAPNRPQSVTSAPSVESGKFYGLDLFSAPNPPQSVTSGPSVQSGKFDGLDLFNAPVTSGPSVESGKFDGLDLFNAPNPPQSVTSGPSVESGKFDGLDLFSAQYAPQVTVPAHSAIDLFDLSATSSAFTGPTLNVIQRSVETSKDKLPDTITQKNDDWATFDLPWHANPSQQDFSASGPSSLMHNSRNDIGAPLNEKNNQQSWNSFEKSTTPFENMYTQSSEQIPVQDPLAADPYLTWGISENFKMRQADLDTRPAPFLSTTPHALGSLDFSNELPVLDGAQSHGLGTKSRNPFDFPSDTDLESTNFFLDMSSIQSDLPNHNNMSTPWFPESAPSMPISNIQAQGPVASISGNPFG